MDLWICRLIYFDTGNPPDQKDQMIDALDTLKERLEKGDPNILSSVINDLAKVFILYS